MCFNVAVYMNEVRIARKPHHLQRLPSEKALPHEELQSTIQKKEDIISIFAIICCKACNCTPSPRIKEGILSIEKQHSKYYNKIGSMTSYPPI